MSEMTQQDGGESQGKFKYSDASMEEYNASIRRYVRPTLVFLPTMLLALVIPNQVLALVVLGVGLIVSMVMVQQNYLVQRRLNVKLKAEKREWETKHPGPS
jgi:hypothetical protein